MDDESTSVARSDDHVAQARLATIVATAPVAIVEVDFEGRVRWWNPAASSIFSWPPLAEALSGPPVEFPDAARGEVVRLCRDLHPNEPKSRELLDVDVSGRRRDFSVSASLFPASPGEADSVLLLIDDVTDHRALKAEVHHAQQMETRGRVASSVAHDFNNLLTLISGYAELLTSELEGVERSLTLVRDIQATAARAALLTAQLQAIGRADALDPVELSPSEVLHTLGEVVERIVGEDVAIAWALAADAGSVMVDAGQFEQMILNLAINARDAMPDGGELRIAVAAKNIERVRRGDAQLTAGPYVSITVSDTGVGMDGPTRRRCFDAFFTTKGPLKGTGLGLAAAKRLVEGARGVIRCVSELGVGTTFEILLPAVASPARVEAAETERPRSVDGATILVAEDDDAQRQLVVQVLTRRGYEVLVADSGEDALAVAQEFDGRIDLLVSDVVMGTLSGPDVAVALQRRNPSLGVLLTSGTARADVLNVLAAGTGAFLRKPFRPSALLAQVDDLLTRV